MALPDWVSYTSPTQTPNPGHPSKPIHVSYGLHKRCSSLTGGCSPFPVYEDCHGDERSFCSMWRSVGFLMNFCVVFELATLVAFAVILLGGRDKREQGWKMLAGLLGLVMVCQIACMAIVVSVCTVVHGERGPMLTDRVLGFPVRSRQPLLCWLEAGQELDSLHRLLGRFALRYCWCLGCGLFASS